MSISLLETYVEICKLFSKIDECKEKLEKTEKQIKEYEEKIKELQKLIDEGKCFNDIPEYEDNREGCKTCSGCRYCQSSAQFDLADEI